MIADVEPEATPLRRLIVFAAIFLSMLTLGSVNFARDPPLLAPPVVVLIVFATGVAGLLIWVRGRWSRAMLWIAAGIALMGSAGTALLGIRIDILGAATLAAGAVGLIASGVVAAALLTQRDGIEGYRVKAQWTVLVTLLVLSLVGIRIGPGPTLGALIAGVALLMGWMLRPEAEAPDAPETAGP